MRLRPRNNQADRVLARSISLRITVCGPRIRVPRTSKPEPSNGFAKPCVARRLLALTPQKIRSLVTETFLESTICGRGYSPMQHTFCRRIPAVLAAAILLPVIAAAQQPQPAVPNPSVSSVLRIRSEVPAGVRRIALSDAQKLAQAANDPLVRLG